VTTTTQWIGIILCIAGVILLTGSIPVGEDAYLCEDILYTIEGGSFCGGFATKRVLGIVTLFFGLICLAIGSEIAKEKESSYNMPRKSAMTIAPKPTEEKKPKIKEGKKVSPLNNKILLIGGIILIILIAIIIFSLIYLSSSKEPESQTTTQPAKPQTTEGIIDFCIAKCGTNHFLTIKTDKTSQNKTCICEHEVTYPIE